MVAAAGMTVLMDQHMRHAGSVSLHVLWKVNGPVTQIGHETGNSQILNQIDRKLRDPIGISVITFPASVKAP